ncbi:hypothetical protein [Geitlerinema sp. PCC 7407]|uniref:hypothetical protein n=1 Tax=Geitlerinema sp. PCC 7407 TaxID=1173025 RepID=UPI00029FCB50|nr:hypothetical protein [Geitlerinema sp. PCC 7407]AFY67272.1 hypothetical protein GEI7407_2799 [Geitlerinema sp. PCC 7407]
MESVNVFAEAVRKGSSSSQEEVKRDLASLLRSSKLSNADSFVSEVEALLSGDTPALAWLDEIKILSQSSPLPKFGPVLATEAGSAERLALGVRLRSSLETKSDAKDFVEESNTDLLNIFDIAKQIQDYLSDASGNTNSKQRLWVREFTPAFLQEILNNQSVSRELTVAATGGDLSTEWEEVESWVVSWADFRKKSPNTNPGGDGFFEPQHANYQPAAIHPLVLRILRKTFLSQLNAGVTQETQDFCQWLTDHVFDRELLDAIKLESIFASGSLILALAQQQGVVIQEDRQISVPTTVSFWGDLSERVLKTVVNNSQQLDDVPSFWKNTQVEIRQLLYSCPEWHSTPLINNLRSRAARLLEEELEVFKTVILQESSKLTDDKFKPEVELSSQNALPELRPGKPIGTITPEREEYFKKLDNLNNQIADISNFDLVVQEIANKTLQIRTAFKQRLVSPLAEPALLVLSASSFEQSDRLNLALVTYLRQQISQFSLDSKLIRSGSLIQETLANQPAWIDIINQTATTNEQVLSNWLKLDIWDGLRGRLARASVNEGDLIVTQYLSQQLPDWLQNDTTEPPAGLDLNAIRPILAELVHLGVSLQLDTYGVFATRLENLINRSDLDAALKALLAAVRLELGLTALAVGAIPSQAFKQFESPSEVLFEQFAGWIQLSIESSNVWESRAGMNALILLARMAEGTGDLLLVKSAIKTAMPLGSRASRLVSESVNQLLSTGGNSKGSGLPLAFAAFDLARHAREVNLSIAPQVTKGFAPIWAPQPIPDFIDQLTNQLGTATRTALQKIVADGGIGLKVLLLSLLQIKLDELDLERQLIVQPLRRNTSPQEAKLRHNLILRQIDDLQKAVRFVFCREQLLLNELPEASSEIKPWWQTRYWLASSSNSPEIGQLNLIGVVGPTLVSTLEGGNIPSDIQTLIGGLSGQATVRPVLKGQRWLIVDPQLKESDKTYQVEQDSEAVNLNVYQVDASFLLINWIASYPNNVEVSLLSLAASLSATVPAVSEDNPQDIDGRYEGEFPDLSWKNATNNLKNAVDNLKDYEDKYGAALQKQIDGNVADEIVSLLKQPLLLNTADYREQMMAAIAEVREAEADLEVAEFESLATQFEVLANEMLYEAADIEVQRQDALVEISKLDEGIAKLERDAEEISKRQVNNSVDIAKRDVDIAKNTREKALKESEKVKIARKAILREIDLLKSLLEKPTKITIDGDEITANGQIGAMAYKVEATLFKQLNTNLETARSELQRAKDAEAERKKKEKRRKLVGGICRFVGAVIGTIYGGPAGAALGAEIGGAIGELANGVIENKAPEEILVGLIDNGFAIAQAAGVDLEKELNTLGAKGATQLNQFFDQLDSNLGPILDNLPKILDEQLFKDAIVILDLPEVPVLTQLLEDSYRDLQKDIPNLGRLGTTLKAIQYDSPRQFLNQLSDNLFKNTKNNVEEIKALSKAIGKKVEDLQTEEGLREAAERFAKLVVTSVGQEAVNFRQDAISTWIRNKRDNQQWWNNVVQKEAETLVKELFPDSQSQAEVLANLESSLINPEIIRGELQKYLDPWQQELDRRISDITAVKDTSSPKSAVDAAQQSVTYLETCIDKFKQSLLPWLKGEDNTQRTQLLLDLNKLQTDKLPTNNIDLEIRGIDETNALLSEANAKAALDNMVEELERVGLLYKAADLKVSKATLLNKVADLAKLREIKVKDARLNSLKASEKRHQAAQAKVKSAQFNLEAKRALSQAAARRGVEASRIRGTLSQPALRLPNLAAGTASRLREDYVEQLQYAFKAYRELLRYYYAAFSVVDPSRQRIPVLPREGSWFDNFTNWSQIIGQEFSSPSDPSQASDNFEWDLTPQQIKSLFTPEGFRLVIAPHVEERPVLFSVPQEWQIYLDQLDRLNRNIQDDEKSLIEQLWRPGFNQLWIQEFRKNGISISEQVSIKAEDSTNWRIEDLETEPIEITFLPDGTTLPVRWNIRRSISYSVTKEAGKLFVTLRPSPEDVGQSDFGDRHFKSINAPEARTGRIAAIFLTGKIRGSGQFLKETDYPIEVTHLGDIWTTDLVDRIKVQLRKQRTLQDQRDFFIPLGTNLVSHLNDQKAFFTGQGDPDIFGVQGNPLSGTTVIKLKPKGGSAPPPFESLKLQVLYTFWT